MHHRADDASITDAPQLDWQVVCILINFLPLDMMRWRHTEFAGDEAWYGK
jgi:hypothetical protein